MLTEKTTLIQAALQTRQTHQILESAVAPSAERVNY